MMKLTWTRLLASLCLASCFQAAAFADPAEAKPQNKKAPGFELPEIAGPKPWTKKPVNNDPMNFQFVVMTDRNGGERAGVFDKAVSLVNLLRPEFVMSIGDYIQGYTENVKTLNSQWDVFQKSIDALDFPFFHIPGNHDVLNDVEKKIWKERFGPHYYHFKYGEVLFLCLNSDDPDSKLGDEQIKYFEKVLKENQDVRWTLVFVHKPLWTAGGLSMWDERQKEKKHFQNNGWAKFDRLLQGRKYTVFSGHIHHYVERDQKGNKYYSLATTGGGSAMRGAYPYGEFDHVSLVSMTPDGPTVAQLELSGIHPPDFIDEKVYHYSSAIGRSAIMTAEIINVDSIPFANQTVKVRINNPRDLPLKVELSLPENALVPKKMTESFTLAPKEQKILTVELDGSKLQKDSQIPVPVITGTAEYNVEGKPPIRANIKAPIYVNVLRKIVPATAETKVDGNLAEWENLWSEPIKEVEVGGHPHAFKGIQDNGARIAASYDDNFVYVAVKVNDDSVFRIPGNDEFEDDSIDLRIRNYAQKKGEPEVIVNAAPPADGKEKGPVKVRRVKGAESICVLTDGGYALETKIPVEAFGKDWKSLEMNLLLRDRDKDSPAHWTRLRWKPEWKGNQKISNVAEFTKSN